MLYTTCKDYTDRPTKAAYVHEKYGEILKGKVLDVGADNCYLRDLLGDVAKYTGIGIGGNPDIEVNLEKQTIPFDDNCFDAVLCLDVLEHVDNTQDVFDELCRVTKPGGHVIISLPNSYRDFLGMLFGSKDDKALNFKYYGIPAVRPDDRHKWFFSNSDADNYVRTKAKMNNMDIVQIDSDCSGKPKTLKSFLKRSALQMASKLMCVEASDLYYKTHWSVIQKN